MKMVLAELKQGIIIEINGIGIDRDKAKNSSLMSPCEHAKGEITLEFAIYRKRFNGLERNKL